MSSSLGVKVRQNLRLVIGISNWDQGSDFKFRTFQSLPLIDSQEMPLMPAFTAGLSVFALLTMFHYVSVAHISPTVRLSAFLQKFSRSDDLRFI